MRTPASGFAAMVGRDLRLAWRESGDSAAVIVFFVIVATLISFGIGPEMDTLARIAPGIVWTAALLAALLSLDRLFIADFEDGSLDGLIIANTPLELIALAKCCAHWLTTGLPLVAATPLIALFFGLPALGTTVLILGLIIGTPVLSLVGSVGAAVTLGARRSGILTALLVLPLEIPPLIFGPAAVEAVMDGRSPLSPLLLLAALLAAALPLAPLAVAASLRASAE